MSTELLSAKIVVNEEPPKIRNIVSGPTAVAAFEGVAERGPVVGNVDEGTRRITSPEEYAKIFGGLTDNAQDLPLAVQAFFDNGGTAAYISRVVHYTSILSAATKTSAKGSDDLPSLGGAPTAGFALGSLSEPFALVPGDTLDVKIDGGGTQTATFNATAAFVTSGVEPYALVDLDTLTVKIDGGGEQTITFNTAEFALIGAATAAEVAAVINGELLGGYATVVAGPAVRIFSDTLGTDSEVEITGGTGNGALGFPTAPVSGTGNVGNIQAVTAAEAVAVIEAAVAGATTTSSAGAVLITSDTTGAGSSVEVEATSTADTKFGFDNLVHSGTASGVMDTLRISGKWDGAYANDVDVIVSAATSGEADEFNLEIEVDGFVVESFPNLTMNDADPNYVETVVNGDSGSDLVTALDLDALLVAPNDRPANGTYGLAGGNDGLVGLTDTDFVGSVVSGTGLRSFDAIDEIRLLLIPGRATSAVHNAMLTYAEVTRDKMMFCVLDPPEDQDYLEIVTYVTTTASLKESSEFGAIYWPRVQILNPDTALFGTDKTIVVPPSGHIAGMIARTDRLQGGVSEAPAGVEIGTLKGVLGLESADSNDERKRDYVFPQLVNPIVAPRGLPIHVDGARTLKSTAAFPTVGERRGLIFVEQSIKGGLLFGKHRKIRPDLLAEFNRTCRTFLINLTREKFFASLEPKKAFFTDFGPALNTPSKAFARTTIGRIGVATAKPNEFTVLFFSQDQRALEEELALEAA